jgi:hypothetical protein
MQVSEKPTQVRTTSLLTPRHITQQSKVRMHARRYHPKKDSPKVRLQSVHPHCLCSQVQWSVSSSLPF